MACFGMKQAFCCTELFWLWQRHTADQDVLSESVRRWASQTAEVLGKRRRRIINPAGIKKPDLRVRMKSECLCGGCELAGKSFGGKFPFTIRGRDNCIRAAAGRGHGFQWREHLNHSVTANITPEQKAALVVSEDDGARRSGRVQESHCTLHQCCGLVLRLYRRRRRRKEIAKREAADDHNCLEPGAG